MTLSSLFVASLVGLLGYAVAHLLASYVPALASKAEKIGVIIGLLVVLVYLGVIKL